MHVLWHVYLLALYWCCCLATQYYVDQASYYGRSSVVCLSVSQAKMAELVEMLLLWWVPNSQWHEMSICGIFKSFNGKLLAPTTSTGGPEAIYVGPFSVRGFEYIILFFLKASAYLHAKCSSRTANEYSGSTVHEVHICWKNNIAVCFKVSGKLWNFALFPHCEKISAGRQRIKCATYCSAERTHDRIYIISVAEYPLTFLLFWRIFMHLN